MQAIQHSGLKGFAEHHHIERLSPPSLQAIRKGQPGYTVEKAKQFLNFQERIDRELLQHRVITNNTYTTWFEQGNQSLGQIKAFIIQFSVFSNLFLIAQLNKMIHADTLDSMRASKEILANDIGVQFKSANTGNSEPKQATVEDSVEGSTFHFSSAHFEWLYASAKKLDLEFHEIGKPAHGTKATLFFCDELIRLYGGENYQISQAASYAVENWAAAGFWGELIRGFKRFNERTDMDLPLGFFIWHDRIESKHAEHTQEELEELYFKHTLNENTFIQYGNEMLDGVAAFWTGLDEQRRELARVH